VSKPNRNTKKAAQGKARPVAPKAKKTQVSKKAKPAPSKKTPPQKKPVPAKKTPPKKPAPKKLAKNVPPRKTLVKKPAVKAATPKKAAATKPAPAPSKPSPKQAAKTAKTPVVSKPAAVAAKAAPTPSKPAPAPAVKANPAPMPAVSAAKKPAAAAPPPVEVVTTPPPSPVKRIPAQPLPPPGPTKSGALFYDSHMHTPLCKHAWGEPEEYAQQAVKAGLKGIIFTCHCPMPNGFWPTVRMAESEFDTYVAIVQRAADAFKGKLDIRLGIESEYFPGCEEYIASLHQRADFHYVLGAVHWQAKEYLNKFETGTIENFRRTYFDHLAKSAETGLYDCLAHPDLVKNYHPDSWCFAIVKNTVSTTLDRIAATGVAMELNTSGLNKSYSEMNPGLEMLRMMAERKIPVVIGSDSHKPVRVGEHFVTALNHLTEAGYENVSHFLNRQRIDLKISDVLASLKKAADHNA
jgi:histidinol-phosphatase (PHP family)